jgi:outer membrane protein OmpA-like peptidoglycan-associated protein
MRRTLYMSLMLTATFAPAWAQVSSSDDVTVNSRAMGPGYLLYPGGKYGRSVPQLLQPGEKPGAVIHLHMPVHHRRVATNDVAPAPAVTPPITTLAAPPPVTPRRRARAIAPPVTTDTASLPEDSAARLVGANTVGAPAPVKPAPRAPRVSSATTAAPPMANTGATTVPFSFGGSPVASSAPTRTASATPPPRTTPTPATGMKKQSMIPFAAGATNLAASDVNAIHTLAAALNSAVANSAAHVQLYAYGGARGDKSSDSRRLSLKRGLVVRELLIEDGIPSEKIDVHAMGGADDDGTSDRVDVFVRG